MLQTLSLEISQAQSASSPIFATEPVLSRGNPPARLGLKDQVRHPSLWTRSIITNENFLADYYRNLVDFDRSVSES